MKNKTNLEELKEWCEEDAYEIQAMIHFTCEAILKDIDELKKTSKDYVMMTSRIENLIKKGLK